ncbi:hypothetical protein BST61_g9221 [Cercospora zeina]
MKSATLLVSALVAFSQATLLVEVDMKVIDSAPSASQDNKNYAQRVFGGHGGGRLSPATWPDGDRCLNNYMCDSGCCCYTEPGGAKCRQPKDCNDVVWCGNNMLSSIFAVREKKEEV